MGKGPAKVARIVPSRGRTRDGDSMETVIFMTAPKGDGGSTLLCLYFRQTHLFRGKDQSVLGIGSSFLRVQNTFPK